MRTRRGRGRIRARSTDGNRLSAAREFCGARFANLRRRGRCNLHGPVALLLPQALADELFYLVKLFDLIDAAEGDRLALPAGAARASDAVDIGFRFHGHIVIEDMGKACHVDAAGCDIRRHQHPALAGFETVERCLPRVLGFVPVDAGCLNALAFQIPDDAVHAVFRAGKDEGALDFRIGQQLRKQVFFVDLIHIVQALVNGLDGGGDRIDLDVLRVHEEVKGQLFHLGRHGCGKEKGLALVRQAADDLPYVVNKAHVEHPVGLVQDEDLDPIQTHEALAYQVQQAARAGDNNVRAAVKGFHLAALADAAEDDGGFEPETFAVELKILIGLERQFPGRGKDQGADNLRVFPRGVLMQQLQDRQGEGSGLASAGLGAAEDVLSRKDQGDRGRLNRGRCFVPRFMDVL